MIRLGIDAICCHPRLERGQLTFEQLIDECAQLRADHLQTGLGLLSHLRAGGAADAAARAQAQGIALRATGGPIGAPFHRGEARAAADALAGQLAQARALSSTFLMTYSGRYRPELAGRPAEIDAELAHLREVLLLAGPRAAADGMLVLLENASDFTAAELERVFADGEIEGAGVFLDLTNPFNVFEDAAAAIRRLAPLAPAGHVKDFELASIHPAQTFYRQGFELRFRLPGEGVADVPSLIATLRDAIGDRDFELAIEGLDPRPADAPQDQRARLGRSLAFLRAATERP